MSEVSEISAVKRRVTGRGVPLLADEPATLAELFVYAARHARSNALNYKAGGQWRPVSSAELLERAGNIGLGLYSLGLRAGDRAAILAANSPFWTLSDAGCQLAGIVDVPVYTTLAPSSVAFILNNSEAKILFIENKAAYERIAGILPLCQSLETCVFFDADGAAADSRAISISQLEEAGAALRAQRPELSGELAEAAKPGDLATLIYTSGTTGEPKGVMLTHANIISNVIDAGENYTFSSADIPLSVLPLSHVFERSAMYLYLLSGMAVYYAESVERAPDNLREVRPTILVGVPRIFEKVYARAKLKAAQTGGITENIFDWAVDVAKQYAGRSGRDIPAALVLKHFIADRLVFSKLRAFFGGRLRSCITGGAALPNEIYLIFTGAGIPIMQGYGLTETSPVITTNNPINVKLGTVGKPIRNFKVRIAADGEIEADGPGVMAGYYRNETATNEAFTEDGWFKTGDIGCIDGDGFLLITDRKKELFKTSGGKYIAPSPIEQMIRSSRFVSQAVLVGKERKFAAALIVPNFEMMKSYAKQKGLDLETPKQFCKDPRIIDLVERQVAAATLGLARYETVKKITLLENELTVEGGELTPTLKLKRRVIDEKYKEIIDAMYC